MTQLFGTDGIRGTALVAPLDEDTVRRLAGALASLLRAATSTPRLLLAGDTRSSTVTLARWFGSSFLGHGGQVTWAEVLPTPAVSQLLAQGTYDAGVVISASHNPAEDNGIKILQHTGEKLHDEAERWLEQRLDSTRSAPGPELPPADRSLADRYLEHLLASHKDPHPLAGMSIVVDAANGAASGLARPLLERLGARVTMISDCPDGSNINRGCGATAPEQLQHRVRATGADAGLALDGDADRAVLVDEQGQLLDGDDILLVWARQLKRQGELSNDRVVATVMSNLGLEKALKREGISLCRCPVGDRAVWLMMREQGACLGGEQSGHIISSHHAVSGDGLLTGSHVLAIARARGCPLSALSDLTRYPQVLLNVPVAHQRPLAEVPAVCQELAATETRLNDRGRVLLRYSGTEPLVRVMVEGEDAAEIEQLAESLATTIRTALS